MNKEKLITEWKEDLIWCPSQIESNIFIYKGHSYAIYLRWRWSNPWTATLVKMDNIVDDIVDGEWESLDIPSFADYDFKKLEKYVEEHIFDIIKKYGYK